MAKRWDDENCKEVVNPQVDAFIEEVLEVCKKHGFSIAHEDSGGGFIVEKFNDRNAERLSKASIDFRF